MTREDLQEAVFGAFDGTVSAVGVIAPVVIASGASKLVVVAAVGLSINSAWSMGSGQYISDPLNRLRLAAIMCVATLVFSLLPAMPFWFGGTRFIDSLFASIITLGIGVVIAEIRPESRGRSYVLTMFVLAVGVALAVAWGLLAP